MKRWGHIVIGLLGFLILGSGVVPGAWSASRAWLIDDDGRVTKIDLSQNAILSLTRLPTGKIPLEDIAVDAVRGNLFVPNGQGPYDVGIFDLRTLKRKGLLDFMVTEASTPSSETIRFIFPPTGPVFFAHRWNETAEGGNGAFEVRTIDATSFQTIATLTTTPALTDKLMLDATGRTLYSMTDEKPAHIDVFGVPSLTPASRMDLEAFFTPGAFGRDIDGFGSGKVLLVENNKSQRSDADHISAVVYDVTTNRLTPRIQTGLRGSSRFLPQTNRILFNEQTLLTPGARMLTPGVDMVNPGKLHVYDTTTGTQVATVTISGVAVGEIIGVNAAEDTCYYLSIDATAQKRKLSVIDLGRYAVVKELSVSSPELRMVFFDE